MMNTTLEDECRQLVSKLDPDSEQPERTERLYRRASANVEYLQTIVPILAEQLPDINNDFLVRWVWRATMDHQRAGRDVSQTAHEILSWMNVMGPATLAGMAYGEGVSWKVRDDHLAKGLPLLMDWCEQHGRRAMGREVLDYMIHLVMGTANRQEDEAAAMMAQVSSYYGPHDLISPDGGPQEKSWIWCWANSNFNQQTNTGCGHETLKFLMAWGIDLETTDENGETVLAWALRKSKDTYETARHKHTMDLLVEAGASWKPLMDQANEQQRELLQQVPGIRNTLLAQVAHATVVDNLMEPHHSSNSPKPKL